MTGTFVVDEEKVTVAFSYKAEIALVQDVINDCAEYLWIGELDEWGEVLNPFNNSSNQERLNVVDIYIKDILIKLANDFKIEKVLAATREGIINHTLEG